VKARRDTPPGAKSSAQGNKLKPLFDVLRVSLEFRFDAMNMNPNMTMCDRIYQNPSNRTEIWINIGWSTPGFTRYPAWEPWMGQFVSQDDYSKLINVCVEGFKDPPFDHQRVACAMCCTLMCPCACICTGPYLWHIKQQVDAMNTSIGENLTATGVTGARLDMVQAAGAHGGQWVDHRGTELLLPSGEGGTRLGGPPLGYNLVINTKAQLAWPPQQVVAAPVQAAMVAPATVGNTAAANFCASCGKQREGNGKFCTGCGAAVG